MKFRLQRLVGPASAILATSLLAACGADSNPLASPNSAELNTSANEISDSKKPENPGKKPKQVLVLANAQNPDFAGQAREFNSPGCDSDGNSTRDGGAVYSVNLQSGSGETIAFSVFEPANLNCALGNPLVLHGHGYGGSRSTSPGGMLADLVASGAGVISIDQRGFGESSGSVRVMDPDFEGQDLLQILDWAENNLDWLRYRNDGSPDGREFNMVAGSTGGSYGGGYQLLIHNIDPLARLDALTPDITWNDLRYSLNPGAIYGLEDSTPADGQVAAKGVVKSGWGLALVAGGEAGSAQNDGQDTLIRQTLLNAVAGNQFPDESLEFFRYHSPSYYCDPEVASEQAFLQETIVPGVPQATPRPVDILFTQGFRDTLFNFNDALHNFVCYRNLTDNEGNKADVRLYTHQTGHILGVSSQGMEPFEGFAEAGGNLPEFQTAAGPARCGETGLSDAQFAFLAQKLFTAEELPAVIALQDTAGQAAFASLDAHVGEVCLSHDDTGADAVYVSEEAFLSNQAPQGKGKATNSVAGPVDFAFPVGTPETTVTSGLLGTIDYLPAPAMQPIELPAGLNTLAGIPTATINVAPLVEQASNPVCPQIQDGSDASPVNLLGLDPACDPIVFVGLGVLRDGNWRLIDSQVVPVRGFGERHVELTGIAEVIAEGEELSIMVYGYHPQYPATASRDQLSSIVQLSGQLSLPWVAN